MGQRDGLMRRPPKFVHGFIDRHGKPRFYFRRPGFKQTPLPGLPWSPEFMAAYEEALRDQPLPVGTSRAKPGTMNALALSYFASPDFRRSLRPTTQKVYRWLIEKFCREHGDKRVAKLQREHIINLMRTDVPGSANGLRKMLRVLMRHAIDIGLRADDPTRDVKALRVKTGGHHSWTDIEITQFEQRHAVGTRARLALALLLYTGQRRGDVIRMGAQHIRDGFLHVKQEKTGAELAIPVHAELQAVLAATPSGHLTFLTTQYGGPFKPPAFTAWFRQECNEAGLPHCSAHGLRKAAARRLAEAGCSTHEIAAITGHATLTELVRYTKAVDQRGLPRPPWPKPEHLVANLPTGLPKRPKNP